VTRIIVLGGRGFFGRAVVELLRLDGGRPLVASRRPGADLLIDAEDAVSVGAALKAGDVVIDTSGPFQRRSTLLVETAIATGCSVIDISDSLDYACKIQQIARRINGVNDARVLTSCSAVSAVSAALVRHLDVPEPVRISAFLAPAVRHTATAGTTWSLFSSLERPIRVLRAGALVERRAFTEERAFHFPSPVGPVSAGLCESPDAVTLPLIWSTLRDVDLRVDTRSRWVNALCRSAADQRSVRAVTRTLLPIARSAAKWFGATSGGFDVEVEDRSGARVAAGFVHATRSYLVAVAPAVLAANAIAAGTFEGCGLVRADRYVDAGRLVDYLRRTGVEFFTSPPHPHPLPRSGKIDL